MVERNPAELETFHLAYWVIDSGFSALAAVLGSYPSWTDGWHSFYKENIAVPPSPFPSCDKQSKHVVGHLMLNGMVYSYDLCDIVIPLGTVA